MKTHHEFGSLDAPYMTDDSHPTGNRREFLTGKALRKQVEAGGGALADALLQDESARPVAGDTLRLETRAMACSFAILMNPDRGGQIPIASDALELVHELESQMTVYRDDSELAAINREAGQGPVSVEPGLYSLLRTAAALSESTGGAFEPTAGPLIQLWKVCRDESRIPTESELATAREQMGCDAIDFDDAAGTVEFTRPGLSLDLGGIGKGYALDRCANALVSDGMEHFLLHGGQSSMIARGQHADCDGWPVGIRDPFFPKETLLTVLLKDRALSTSGSGVQFFRHAGRRYGHILDPRTGMPAEGMLSVTVLAPTAAEADALSTAFFVKGLENASSWCDNHKQIGAVLIPLPESGRTLAPVVRNIEDGVLFFAEDSTSGE